MKFGSRAALALLIAQPILFFRRVLLNPDRHIPYDLLGFHTPLADFIAYALRQGEWPLWDPHPYCGYPLHADVQAQLFYPPAWLAIAARNFGRPDTMFYWLEWLVALHMVLAGALTFWLLRRMGCGVGAALFGGTAFQLGAFFASQAQHLGAISAAAWLPLAWLAVWELRTGWRRRWFALLAIALALSFLAGFLAMTLVVWASTLVWALALAGRRAWLNAGLTLAAGGAAVVLVLVQLVPTWRWLPMTAASQRADWSQGAGSPPWAWWSLVVPNYHGVFTPFDAAKFTGEYEFSFLYCYCGMATIVLAAAALVWGSRRFTLLAVLFFVLQCGSYLPGFTAVFAYLPRSLRGAVYMNFFLGAATLALALAAARLLDRAGPRWAWALSVLTAADLVMHGAARPMNSSDLSWRHVSSERRVDDLRSIPEFVEELVSTGQPPWRIDAMDLNYSFTMSASLRRVPTPNGDNPLAPLRLLDLRRLFAEGQPWERQLPVVKPESPLLDFLNVRYLLAFTVKEDRAAVERAGWERLERTEAGLRVYRNREVLPRFFLVPRVVPARDGAEALRLVPSLNLADTAVVEGATVPASAGGAVRVLRYGLNEVECAVEAAGETLLVTSESFHPDWRAWVDGAPVPVLRVNSAFRGVALGAGTHRVVMRYEASGLGWWLALSASGWLLAGWAVVNWRKQGHPSSVGRAADS